MKKTIKEIEQAIENFKKQPIKNFNPYQATELPSIEKIRESGLRAQIGAQVRDQIWDQIRNQILPKLDLRV